LTGGGEAHYQIGLLQGLVEAGVEVEFIGNDRMSSIMMTYGNHVRYLNLRGNQDPSSSFARKLGRVFFYYLRLVRYAASTSCVVFHIQWENKFRLLDRILLPLYYDLLGKKLVLTVHNVNSEERDGHDGPMNRFVLRVYYRLMDHIIVHTAVMKEELVAAYGMAPGKVSIIPHGINIAVCDREGSPGIARDLLNIPLHARVILFFGTIDEYKGVDILIDAFSQLYREDQSCRLILAGQPRGKWRGLIESMVEQLGVGSAVTLDLRFVPDEVIPRLFLAADCCVLPYRRSNQSGVLFLSFAYGLPVIVADSSGCSNEVTDGKNGIIVRGGSALQLHDGLSRFFRSELHTHSANSRSEIRAWASRKYSWTSIGALTRRVYLDVSD